MTHPPARNPGRLWAYTGAILGGAVSIAANVAHSFIPPKEVATPAAWSPEVGAVVGSVVWPVFLFVAVEILARVAWPVGRVWQLIRWGGIMPVAFVAALVSYRHLSGLLGHYGEEPIVCILGPLAVDGLMVMATGAILATGHHRPTTEPLTVPAAPDATRVPDAIGVPAPITISTEPTAPPVPVDVPPPVVESTPVTPAPARPETAEPARPSDTDSTAVPTPVVIATRATQPSSTSPDRSAATSFPRKPSPRPRPSTAATPAPQLARPAADTSVTRPDAAQLKLPLVAPELLDRAREAARQHRAEHGEPIRPGQLAARLRVSTEQATDALALLQGREPIPTVNGRRPSKATR